MALRVLQRTLVLLGEPGRQLGAGLRLHGRCCRGTRRGSPWGSTPPTRRSRTLRQDFGLDRLAGRAVRRLGRRPAARRPGGVLHLPGADRPAGRRPAAGDAHPGPGRAWSSRWSIALPLGTLMAVRHRRLVGPAALRRLAGRRRRPRLPGRHPADHRRSPCGWGGCPANGWTPPAQDPVDVRPAARAARAVAGPGAGRGADPLRAQRRARRAARGLPAHRPGQGAAPDAGAASATGCATRRCPSSPCSACSWPPC